MSDEFHEEKLKKIIADCHVRARRLSTIPLAEPRSIANLAYKLVAREFIFDAGRTPRLAFWSGYCIYAMEHYGLNFTSLCDVVNFDVARVVGDISMDPRLNDVARMLDFVSHISRKPKFEQAIVLAETYERVRVVRTAVLSGAIHGLALEGVEPWLMQQRDRLCALRQVAPFLEATTTMKRLRKTARQKGFSVCHYRMGY